jgi:hypothetical protein
MGIFYFLILISIILFLVFIFFFYVGNGLITRNFIKKKKPLTHGIIHGEFGAIE